MWKQPNLQLMWTVAILLTSVTIIPLLSTRPSRYAACCSQWTMSTTQSIDDSIDDPEVVPSNAVLAWNVHRCTCALITVFTVCVYAGTVLAAVLLFADGRFDTIGTRFEHLRADALANPLAWVLERTGWPARHLSQAVDFAMFAGAVLLAVVNVAFGAVGNIAERLFPRRSLKPWPGARACGVKFVVYLLLLCIVLALSHWGETLEAYAVVLLSLLGRYVLNWAVWFGWLPGFVNADSNLPHETVFNVVLSDGQMAVAGWLVALLFIEVGGVFPVAVLLRHRSVWWGSVRLVLGILTSWGINFLAVIVKDYPVGEVPAGYLAHFPLITALLALLWLDDRYVAWRHRVALHLVDRFYAWRIGLQVLVWASIGGMTAPSFLTTLPVCLVYFAAWVMVKRWWPVAKARVRHG